MTHSTIDLTSLQSTELSITSYRRLRVILSASIALGMFEAW